MLPGLTLRRAWRGEVDLQGKAGQITSLLMRADPVYATQVRVLGFVILFTDLAERKAAETARRRFQEETVERHRAMTQPLDTRGDLMYRNLMSSVVGNAQLAALEIAAGMDLDRMPEMLESVQSSVARSSQLLEHLIWHVTGSDNGQT